MNTILLILLLAGSAAAIAYFLSRSKGDDIMSRVAAIDAAAGVEARGTSFFRRVLDERRTNALAGRLQEAGWYTVTPQAIVSRCCVGAAVGAGLGFGLMLYLHQTTPIFFVLTACVAAYGAHWPVSALNRAVDQRKIKLRRELPDFLDVLSTTVDAGVALNAAIATAAQGLHGPLGEELQAALQDIRLGRSRADALVAMAQRTREPDITTATIAIVQSERLGASVTEVLAQLANETREKRFIRAEELAAQLPNKLVFPVGLCMLPALLLIIFGAVVSKLLDHH
ncbi:MAG TPA: type II secretion system F family protein [Candidatus Baltobacteraceae bacterium]|nr:type II secretion system F family protein [Candidatus Baltobacteraceae bacterium]